MSQPKDRASLHEDRAQGQEGQESEELGMSAPKATEAGAHRDEDVDFEHLKKRFFEAEAECSDRLIPMEWALLIPKRDSFLALCRRLETGEELTREPFIRILREMEDVLFQIPEARWQILRSTVKELILVVDEDAGAYAASAEGVSEFILKRRGFLKSETDYPFSIENIKGRGGSGQREKAEEAS